MLLSAKDDEAQHTSVQYKADAVQSSVLRLVVSLQCSSPMRWCTGSMRVHRQHERVQKLGR